MESAPKGYNAIPYDVTLQLKNRAHKWGEIDEEDTAEWLIDNNHQHSNSAQWFADAPKGYAAVAPTDYVQIPIGEALRRINQKNNL